MLKMRREALDGPEVSTYAARYPTVANVPGSGVKRQRATWHFYAISIPGAQGLVSRLGDLAQSSRLSCATWHNRCWRRYFPPTNAQRAITLTVIVC